MGGPGTEAQRAAGRLRLLAVGVFAAGLIWAIATHSLVAALSESRPQWALALNSDDPGTLMVLVERAIDQERARIASLAKAKSNAAAGVEHTPPAGFEDDLRRWVTSVLAQEPANARALAILGDLARRRGDDKTAATLLGASARRTAREPLVLGWLIEEALKRRDWSEVVRHTDTMLRYFPETSAALSPLLADLLHEPETAPAVNSLLARGPPWRRNFLPILLQSMSDARLPLDLFLALKDTPHPPSVQELRQYLDFLIGKGFFDLAYYTWLQFLAPEQLAEAGLLFNGSFESRPSGLPFDWVFARASEAAIERRGDSPSERALVLHFGDGRARVEHISQLLRLQPGRYRVQGVAMGDIRGMRGVRWQVRCLEAQRRAIGESAMLMGRMASWTEFSFDVEVPTLSCAAQELRLFLDARTPSEQLVSGTIGFDDLSVRRLP